jgi:hypothetical protein
MPVLSLPLHHYEGIMKSTDHPAIALDDARLPEESGAKFLHDNPMSYLFIDLGMGKTIICLTLIRDLMDARMEGQSASRSRRFVWQKQHGLTRSTSGSI